MIVEAPLMAELGGPTECAACGAVMRGVEFKAGTPFYVVTDEKRTTSTTTVWPCGHVFRPREGPGWDCDEDERVDMGQVTIENGGRSPSAGLVSRTATQGTKLASKNKLADLR